MADNYFERCYLTWRGDATRARQAEARDDCIHKPNNRFQWVASWGRGWTLAGELPTIMPDATEGN